MFNSLKTSNKLTGKQISAMFLVNEKVTVSAKCSFRRNIRQYCSTIKNIPTTNIKTVITETYCIKVTCTHHHKTAFFETIYIQLFKNLKRQTVFRGYVFVTGSVKQCLVMKSNHCKLNVQTRHGFTHTVM